MAKVQITQIQFDYSALDVDDRQFVKVRANGIREAAKRTAENIVLIGQWLNEVKECLPHGQWLPWLKTEFGWSEWTARNFMQVHELSKSGNFHDLSIDVSALYLIAAPKTPDPVREEIIHRARNGERITHAKAAELVQTYQKAQEIPTPAVARQIAIATGLATLSTDHTYILPMSREEEERVAAEQLCIRNLYSAIELIAETEITPEQMAALGERYFCRNLSAMAQQAAAWLTTVAKEAAQ